jgi:hypothetical protein
MNIINARLNNLLERKKAVAVVATATAITPVITVVPDLRSSSSSNQPKHRTMSISMIASLIQESGSDVRKVAEKIIETQKFNTLPQLVSREEIDRKVLDSNEILLFVGVRDLQKKKYVPEISAADRVKNIKTGFGYLVNGILGPAMYAVEARRDPKAKDNDEEAIMYAYNQAVEYSKTDKKKGIVLRMTLKSDARTITYFDFLNLLKLNNTQIKAELGSHINFAQYLNIFLNTPSLVAIAQGYDAITNIPDGTVVVLNRGALRIQKTNATSKNAMYAQVMMVVEAELEKEREKQEAAEKKKKEQEKREREKKKKLLEKQQVEKVEEESDLIKTKSYSNFVFDNAMYNQLLTRDDLNAEEKSEILNFVSAYNNSSEEMKSILSEQLREIIQ